MSTLLEREAQRATGAPRDRRQPGMAPRKKRRVRMPHWSRRTYVILGILGAVLMGVLVWLFYFSSFFVLNSLVVEGLRRVPPKKVADAADLTSGTPLARIDMGAVESRVSDVTDIESVSVTRRWPDTIVIHIVERQRVGYLKSGSRYDLLDSHGFAFTQVKNKPKNMPEIAASEGENRNAALQVLNALPTQIATRVNKITAEKPDNIVLDVRGGYTVAWGGPDDSQLKADVLSALIVKGTGKWIDLRAPLMPTSAQASPKPITPSPTTSPTDGSVVPSPSIGANGQTLPAPSTSASGALGVLPSMPASDPNTTKTP